VLQVLKGAWDQHHAAPRTCSTRST